MLKKMLHGSRKKILLLPATLVILTLAGCASNADTLMSPGPTVNSTQMPGTQLKEDVQDMLPGMSPENSASPTSDMPVNSSNTPNTLEESRKASENMEENIDLLSEIDDASVVAIGNQALVGVEFEKQYQGGLDDRIRKMILSRIQMVSKGVTELYITDDASVREKIDALADQLETATSLPQITSMFTEITSSIEPYRQ